MEYEFGMHLASRSTKRTGSIVISTEQINRDTYDKVTLKNNSAKNTPKPKKRTSKSIQDIEKGSLLNLKNHLDDLQIDDDINEENISDIENELKNENNNKNNNNNINDDEKEIDNNNNYNKNNDKNVLNFVKNASKNTDKLQGQSYISNNSVLSTTSIQASIFHPNNRVGNSMFNAPNKSTLSNAATVDELDQLNGIEELHNYDKHKELGTGADAFVYEVVDRRDSSHVAMKLTKRKSGRYRTEIHLLYQLRTCPYVVKLLKVLEDDNVYVLILEQAPLSLEQLLYERCTEIAMQERVSREIITNVFKGLKSIHNLGFVHKDVKPENVLIFADRLKRKLQAKIADFGFATRCELSNNSDKKIQLSKNQMNEFIERVCDKCGTPGFWAPELVAQCVNIEDAFKMDVFSCGVTLYRMLCNEMPFGLFETWELKKEDNKTKLAKTKPNFQIVSWTRVKKNGSIGKNTKTKNENEKFDYIRKQSKQKLTSEAEDLLRGMLRIRPHKRFNITDCLKHKWTKKN